MNSEIEDYFTSEDKLSNEDGLEFAFAITTIDGKASEFDSTYGELKAFYREVDHIDDAGID